jgi:hypothetical protein
MNDRERSNDVVDTSEADTASVPKRIFVRIQRKVIHEEVLSCEATEVDWNPEAAEADNGSTDATIELGSANESCNIMSKHSQNQVLAAGVNCSAALDVSPKQTAADKCFQVNRSCYKSLMKRKFIAEKQHIYDESPLQRNMFDRSAKVMKYSPNMSSTDSLSEIDDVVKDVLKDYEKFSREENSLKLICTCTATTANKSTKCDQKCKAFIPIQGKKGTHKTVIADDDNQFSVVLPVPKKAKNVSMASFDYCQVIPQSQQFDKLNKKPKFISKVPLPATLASPSTTSPNKLFVCFHVNIVDLTDVECCGYNYVLRLVDPLLRRGHAIVLKSVSPPSLVDTFGELVSIIRYKPNQICYSYAAIDRVASVLAANYPDIQFIKKDPSDLMNKESDLYVKQIGKWLVDHESNWIFGVNIVQAVTNCLPL